jgi:protease IV
MPSRYKVLSLVAFHLMLLAFLGGCGVPSFLVTPVGSSSSLQEKVVKPGQGFFAKKIVIIEIEGMIANTQSGGLLQPTENDVSRFVQQLDKAASDEDVAAVVLRINSPGGTVTASDTLYQSVMRFRQKTGKPVVASAQEMVASGGYYIACASDKIVVHPTSVVGSIGVIFNSVDASDTIAKLGLRVNAVKSGPLKDIGSPFKHLEDDERAVMQSMVDEYSTDSSRSFERAARFAIPRRFGTLRPGRSLPARRPSNLALPIRPDYSMMRSTWPNSWPTLRKRP